MSDAAPCGMLFVYVKVLLADDEAHVRSALRLVLEEQADVSIVGETATISDLLRQVMDAQPEVLLLDWDLPGMHTQGALALLHTLRPTLRVIAMSGRPEARREALCQGAGAFVCKGDAPDALLGILRSYASTD